MSAETKREESFVLSVDVGSASVRTAVIAVGKYVKIVSSCSRPITIYKYKEQYEQNADEIWNSVCLSLRECLEKSNNPTISSIGFSATCSLVVIAPNNAPISVTSTENDNQQIIRDIIMWMDHRALDQAHRINLTNHSALQFVGGKISLEMQAPKLLWLKENLSETYNKAEYFMDLADYLTFRATGSTRRSICTTTCKWNLVNGNWDDSFWSAVGLNDLKNSKYIRIGCSSDITAVGDCTGTICKEFAKEINLPANASVTVASGMIDAHAGALAMLCSPPSQNFNATTLLEFTKQRISLLCGTSACFMAASSTQCQIPGIWGPYLSALIPGLYLHEGGQSACGALLDYLIASHPAGPALHTKAKRMSKNIYSLLNEGIRELGQNSRVNLCLLTKSIHVLPYFHGNRSPYSDPLLKGMISGLTLENTEQNLCLQYYAALQSLAYEAKNIIHHMQVAQSEYNFECIVVAADITQRTVLVSQTQTMLLGAGIVAAAASKTLPSLFDTMKKVSPPAEEIKPNTNDTVNQYHLAKFQIFKQMHNHQQLYSTLMKPFD